MQIDHQCHRRDCVNPSHLRPVTRKQNQENRAGAQRRSRSGIRGVYWDSRDQRWRGGVRHNGRHVTVGGFDTAEAAEAAVIAKRCELFTHNDGDRAVNG
jgi:hypothetical protein